MGYIMISKLKDSLGSVVFYGAWAMLFSFVIYSFNKTELDSLMDFKGGIQNHLVWSVKGECHFVRPVGKTTVTLVRVEDCDKK
jgi:hypothetical protein